MIPTALAGALQGAAAALLAALAVWGGARLYGDAITEAVAGSLGAVDLIIPTGIELVLFVAAGAALGLVGGALAGASRVAR